MVHALALKYLRLLKPYKPQDIRNVIFNTFLESTSDGVIEFYEFIDLLRLVELHPNIIHIGDLKEQIRTMQSSGVIRDPQGFVHKDSETNERTDILPGLTDVQRDEYKEAFKFLDINKDGWITAKELIIAIRNHTKKS